MARVAPEGVRTPEQFAAVRDALSAAVVDELFQAVSLTARILTLHRDVERAVKGQNSMTLLAALGDVKAQLAALLPPGFVSQTGLARLVRAVGRRAVGNVALLVGRPKADAGGALPLDADAAATLAHARWLLEEYRVSLFAQQLGTAEPVSLQRITKALAATT